VSGGGNIKPGSKRRRKACLELYETLRAGDKTRDDSFCRPGRYSSCQSAERRLLAHLIASGFGDDTSGAVAKHCGVMGSDWRAIQVGYDAFSLPSPALIALSPVDIGPNYWKHRAPGRESRSHCVTSRVRPRLLYYFSSTFMPDPVAWHAERLRRG